MIGTAPNLSDLANSKFFTNGTMESSYDNWNLAHNTSIYATLRAFSNAIPTVSAVFVSAPVRVDLTNPIIYQVNDGASIMDTRGAFAWRYRDTNVQGEGDVDVLGYASYAYANWFAADAESSIEAYYHSTIDSTTKAILAESIFTESATSIGRTLNTTLIHGQKNY